MEKLPQSRRKFITTVALLLASGSLLIRYLTPRGVRKRQVLVSAAAKDVPINGALVFMDERLVLLRDQKGVYALNLICTHLGCTVTVREGAISCPCHGSLFDRQGNVLKGPADRPLARLPVQERDGILEVMQGQL